VPVILAEEKVLYDKLSILKLMSRKRSPGSEKAFCLGAVFPEG